MLTSNDLNIVRNLTISGSVAHSISVSSGSSNHIIRVFSGVFVTISNLVFKDSKPSKPSSFGYILNLGTLTLTNSTVSGNTGDRGGGITASFSPRGPHKVTITFSTITGNTASVGADIEIEALGSSQHSNVTISISIVAGDHAYARPDISVMLISYGYNVFQDNSEASSDPVRRA